MCSLKSQLINVDWGIHQLVATDQMIFAYVRIKGVI
jgi:hypothetical protein